MSSSFQIPPSDVLKRSSALVEENKRQCTEELGDRKYLPLEALEIVASHLNKKDLASFHQASRLFNAAAQAAKIQEQKYLAHQELRALCDLQPARPVKIVSYLDLYQHIVTDLDENLDAQFNLTRCLKQELIPQLKSDLEAFYTHEVASSVFELSKSCYKKMHKESSSCLDIEQEYRQLKYALVVKALTYVVSASSNPNEARGFAVKKACDAGYETIALELLVTGSITQSFRAWALYSAAGQGHLNLAEALLKSGSIAQYDLGVASIKAAEFGHLKILEAILATGPITLNHRGMGVSCAANNGHLTCVQALLANGEILNPILSVAVMHSILKNYQPIFNVLLAKQSLDENDRGKCVQAAANNNHLEMVEALLLNGPISKESRGMSVWTAANKGNLAMVKTLLESGEIFENILKFSLSSAKLNGHEEIVQFLESKKK